MKKSAKIIAAMLALVTIVSFCLPAAAFAKELDAEITYTSEDPIKYNDEEAVITLCCTDLETEKNALEGTVEYRFDKEDEDPVEPAKTLSEGKAEFTVEFPDKITFEGCTLYVKYTEASEPYDTVEKEVLIMPEPLKVTASWSNLSIEYDGEGKAPTYSITNSEDLPDAAESIGYSLSFATKDDEDTQTTNAPVAIGEYVAFLNCSNEHYVTEAKCYFNIVKSTKEATVELKEAVEDKYVAGTTDKIIATIPAYASAGKITIAPDKNCDPEAKASEKNFDTSDEEQKIEVLIPAKTAGDFVVTITAAQNDYHAGLNFSETYTLEKANYDIEKVSAALAELKPDDTTGVGIYGTTKNFIVTFPEGYPVPTEITLQYPDGTKGQFVTANGTKTENENKTTSYSFPILVNDKKETLLAAAGKYIVSFTLTGDYMYNERLFSQELTIEQKPITASITLTGNNSSDYNLKVALFGVIEGDTVTPTLIYYNADSGKELSAKPTEDGKYAAKVTGINNNNYFISNQPGYSFTISKGDITGYQTGIENQIPMLAAVAIICAFGIAALVVVKKRKFSAAN